MKHLGLKLVLLKHSLECLVAKVYEKGSTYVCKDPMRFIPVSPVQAQLIPVALVGIKEIVYEKDDCVLAALPQEVESRYLQITSGLVIPTLKVSDDLKRR
ncbi:hypothetical protein DRO59_07250 [Candidatus Bathyarchaeota archaeon]|nr:MAG: hypothetical protein DRO59_07250 [Candidatus Bathyarchaeota archaeon]